jgi:hypothetical protein
MGMVATMVEGTAAGYLKEKSHRVCLLRRSTLNKKYSTQKET